MAVAFTVALLASPATAADWLKFGRTTVTGLRPGEWASSDPTSNSDDTPILATSGCENFDVNIFSDADGDGTASASLTYTLKSCPDAAGAYSSDAIEDAACVTFEAGGSKTGTGQTLGAAATYFKVTMGGTFTSSSDPKIIVQCNGPRY